MLWLQNCSPPLSLSKSAPRSRCRPPPQHFDASYAPGCSSWIESFGLIEMQLLEKYKENFDAVERRSFVGKFVEEEGPSLEMSKFSLYFLGSCIPINLTFSYYCHYLHWHRPISCFTLGGRLWCFSKHLAKISPITRFFNPWLFTWK